MEKGVEGQSHRQWMMLMLLVWEVEEGGHKPKNAGSLEAGGGKETDSTFEPFGRKQP